MLKKLVITGIILSVSGSLFAHHALEYIDLESYSTTPQGGYVFYSRYDYFVPDQDNPKMDHWEFTPGFSYGITNRLMCDTHFHLAKFGSDHIIAGEDNNDPLGPAPFIEAIAPSVHYQFTKANDWPVDLAGTFTYEYPLHRSRKLMAAENGYEGTLIISKEIGKDTNLCLNLSRGREGNENSKNWGIGIKTPLSQNPRSPEVGLEFFNDYEGGRRLIGGIFLPLQENIIFKVGLGFGNEASEEESRLNFTMMYIF